MNGTLQGKLYGNCRLWGSLKQVLNMCLTTQVANMHLEM